MKPLGPWSTKPGKAAGAASAGRRKSLLAEACGVFAARGGGNGFWNSLWPMRLKQGAELLADWSASGWLVLGGRRQVSSLTSFQR